MSLDIFKNFLNIGKNQRMALLPLIIKEFVIKPIIYSRFQMLMLRVRLCYQIQLSKLETTIKSKFDLNEVTIKNTVDTSILGGVIINARGKSIDSIKSHKQNCEIII